MKFSDHGSDALRRRNSILLRSRFLGDALQERTMLYCVPEHLQVCAQQVREKRSEMWSPLIREKQVRILLFYKSSGYDEGVLLSGISKSVRKASL